MTTKPPETATADPVALARQRVAELNAQELKFAKQSAKTFTDVSDLRSKRGRAVLGGAAPGEINREIRELEDSIETSAEAAAAARVLRLAALDALRNVEADELDRQAAQLDVDATANEAAVREALEVVVKLADCPYVPQPPRAPDRAIGPGQQGVGAVVVVNAPRPLFQRLRLRAEGLRLEAAQHRLKEPHKAGSVEAESLDKLVDVVFSEAMRIGPSVDAVAAWYEQAVEKVRRRRQQLELAEAPIARLHLEWRAGVVDQGASWIASQSAAPAAATEETARTTQPHAPKNVVFSSSTGEQAVDLDAEYARAAATEQTA